MSIITQIFHNVFVIFLNGLLVSFMFMKTYIFLLIAAVILGYFTVKELQAVDLVAIKPPHERI